MLLGFGLLLGLEHAFEADHIAAVSTLVSKHKNLKRSTILGAFWGLGHTTTLFIAGLLVLVLKITIPEKIALALEFLVGIVIMFLGLAVIRDLLLKKEFALRRAPDGQRHARHGRLHQSHESFIVGLIHGMAGSAALMLLVLSTIPSLALGIIYILVFGLGSMIGMALAAALMSLPFIFTAQRFSSWNTGIRYAIGIFSLLFGAFLMIKIALSGLF